MIKNIIKNRPVAIILQGGSVQILEDRIQEFKDYDICWSALGNFPVIEKHILSKIGKKLDFIFDMATVPHARWDHYEPIRQGRIDQYLNRSDNNAWCTSWGMIRDQRKGQTPYKTFIVDSMVPKDEIPRFMDVPNSATLHIATAIYGGASKIFLFGLDGYSGNVYEGYKSCYKPEETIKERQAALGSWQDGGINRDTDSFDSRVPAMILRYRQIFQNPATIYNCSPVTKFKSFEVIDYDSIHKLIKQ